jgi:hypothetical protein
MVEPGKTWDAKTREALLQLLGGDHALVDRLFERCVASGQSDADRSYWWNHHPKEERICQQARKFQSLLGTLSDRDGHEFVSYVGFGTWATTAPRYHADGRPVMFQLSDAAPAGQLFRQQIDFLASWGPVRRRRGQPALTDRDTLAYGAAQTLLLVDVRPRKYVEGTFAKVLRILFRQCGFSVPNDLFRVVSDAIDAAQGRSEPVERGGGRHRRYRKPLQTTGAITKKRSPRAG